MEAGILRSGDGVEQGAEIADGCQRQRCGWRGIDIGIGNAGRGWRTACMIVRRLNLRFQAADFLFQCRDDFLAFRRFPGRARCPIPQLALALIELCLQGDGRAAIAATGGGRCGRCCNGKAHGGNR